jgi:hypothetical protein
MDNMGETTFNGQDITDNMNHFESLVLQKEVEVIIAKLYYALSLRGKIAQNSFEFTQSCSNKTKIVIWKYNHFGFRQEFGEISIGYLNKKTNGLVIWNLDYDKEIKGCPFDFIRVLLSFDEEKFTRYNPPKQEPNVFWKTVSWICGEEI